MNISFNKSTITYGLLVIVSILLIVYGGTGIAKSRNIADIAALDGIQKGQYVDLTNMEVVPYYILVDGAAEEREVRATKIGVSVDYNYVMAALKGDRYAYALIKTKDGGESFAAGDTTGIIGEVVSTRDELPSANVYNIQDADKSVSELIIKETDVNQRNVTLIPGIFFLLLSVVMLIRERPY